MTRQKPSSLTDRGGDHGGQVFRSPAIAALPAQSRPVGVPIKSVKCPTCSAEPDTNCHTVNDGRDMGSSTHPSRRRMAVRADNQAREAAGTLAPKDWTARPQGALEDPEAPPCPSCGLRIRLNPKSGTRASHTSQGRKPTTDHYACAGSGAR